MNIVKEIIKQDPNFNEATFKSYVDNVFVKMYSAIMYDELETVRHFMSPAVYEAFTTKLDDLNRRNIRQMYDELNVKSTEIVDFEMTETEFTITVKLISRYLDYYLNKETGDFVSGDQETRVEKENLLNLTKKRDFLTQKMARKCPGCGASIDVNNKGLCSYCGQTYNLDDYDYIVTGIMTK